MYTRASVCEYYVSIKMYNPTLMTSGGVFAWKTDFKRVRQEIRWYDMRDVNVYARVLVCELVSG